MKVDKLNKLLESVDPKGELFSEEARINFVNVLEASLKEKVEAEKALVLEHVKAEHLKEIQSLTESHNSAIAELTALNESKINEAISAMDEEVSNEITKLLEEIDNDHSEKLEYMIAIMEKEHKEELETIADDAKAEVEKVNAEADEKLEKMDDDHATKLEEIVSVLQAKIKELQDIVDGMGDSKKSKKENEDDKSETKLDDTGVVDDFNGGSTATLPIGDDEDDEDKLVEDISNYIDVIINDVLKEASSDITRDMNIAKATNLLEKACNILNVNIIKSETTQKNIVESVNKTNNNLNEAKTLLAEKISTFPKAKQMYLTDVLVGISDENLESALAEAVTAYDKKLTKKQQLLKEGSTKTSSIEVPVINPVSLNESIENISNVSDYVKMMRQLNFSKK